MAWQTLCVLHYKMKKWREKDDRHGNHVKKSHCMYQLLNTTTDDIRISWPLISDASGISRPEIFELGHFHFCFVFYIPVVHLYSDYTPQDSCSIKATWTIFIILSKKAISPLNYVLLSFGVLFIFFIFYLFALVLQKCIHLYVIMIQVLSFFASNLHKHLVLSK